jgi:dipeptidyl-peptidase 4
MRKLFLLIGISFFTLTASAQEPAAEANYQLASRFAPKKLDKMIFSTSVDPHWLKKSDRFWYVYETPNGKNWYIVDPAKGEKKALFDKDKLAAELTKIVKDPMDGQNLKIDSLRFVKDENWIQFEVKSSEEVIKKDTTVKKGTTPPKENKIYYFEYNLNTGQLVTLSELKKPKRNPRWASVSPDGQTIVFARNFNLYWMDRANYEKALINEEDSTIKETKLTTDGVEHFAYGDSNNETNVDREKNKAKRKPAFIYWSPDSKRFAMVRSDQRQVKDLWVINSVADPRPTLETYKYHMPGEKEAPISYVLLFDMATKTQKELDVKQFKDQAISLWSRPALQSTRDDDWRPLVWHGTTDKLYFNRTSRDLKRIDVCMVDVNTNTVKPLIEERMNTYV